MQFVISVRLSIAFLAAGMLFLDAPSLQSQDSQSQQNQSAAEAAKRNRERKKAETKAPKVVTNEDLDTGTYVPGQSGVNIGGPPQQESAPPPRQAVAAQEAADKAAEEAGTKKAPGDDAEIVELKKQVAEAEKDLDLMRRELALDSEAYYSKTDFASDKAGKAKLATEQEQIAAKQQEVDDLKARLNALQEEQKRRKAASKQTTTPAQNQQPANPATPQP